MSSSMSASNVLRHLHLPEITRFKHAQNLRSALVSQFLSHKSAVSSATPPSPIPSSPLPTLLTFNPTPVYTTGRREVGTLSQSQRSLLKTPLPPLPSSNSHGHALQAYIESLNMAEVQETLRGGQITFHGPGQLVIYPILDLKSIKSSLWPKGLSVRCYVNLLEETTIKVLSHYNLKGIRTSNPGVWIDEDKKIAALGVHLRRNVTSYGVGLNISTDLRWFDRIVACGLEGKQTTSLQNEGVKRWSTEGRMLRPTKVASIWAKEFARGLWGEEGVVKRIKEEKESMGIEWFDQLTRDTEAKNKLEEQKWVLWKPYQDFE